MSDYRDDSQDTAVISSSTFGGLRTFLESSAKLSELFMFGILVLSSATASASDEVLDTTAYVFSESVIANSIVIDRLDAARNHFDKIKASDVFSHGLMATQYDTAAASDDILGFTAGSLSVDSARVSDECYESRLSNELVLESATASDSLSRVYSALSEESVVIGGVTIDRLRARSLSIDSAAADSSVSNSIQSLVKDSVKAIDETVGIRGVTTLAEGSCKASDSVLFNRADTITETASLNDAAALGVLRAISVASEAAVINNAVIDSIIQSSVINESATAENQALDKLSAVDLVSESVNIDDSIISTGGLLGKAWTANTDTWAMSRYEPYNFHRLFAVDGVMYGESDDGIYKLDESDLAVTAIVRTGKIDMSQGELVHPASAYLEYSLQGSASMTVSTTQKGHSQQYSYLLPAEPAAELTNGRFIFGRGLRGRHFSFELEMVGTHGHINDLTVEHAATKRRV